MKNSESGNGCNQRFFHEAKFFVPNHVYAHEHGGEKQCLTDDAWQEAPADS